MEITQFIDTINEQLIKLFGIDTNSKKPMWRVVWSENETEMRYGIWHDYDENGTFIREIIEAREVKKYIGHCKEKYVLENLVAVPVQQVQDLGGAKISYEPVYVFQTKEEYYLPPRLDICQFIINTIYTAKYGIHHLAKYAITNDEFAEMKRKRLEEIQEFLFGDQSSLGGSTVTGESIIVPYNYGIVKH